MKTIMAVVRPLCCVRQRVTALPQLSLQMYFGVCDGCSVLLNCCLYQYLLLMGLSELNLTLYTGTIGPLLSIQDTLMADTTMSSV